MNELNSIDRIRLRARLLSYRNMGEGGCWRWVGHRNRDGYGVYKFKRRLMLVHRLSWLAWYGRLYSDMKVYHSCSHFDCFNPAHLNIGTMEEVGNNKKVKKRQAKAGKIPTTKLDEAKVRFIREHDGVLTNVVMAKMFGVSKGTIVAVKKRRIWKHVE